METFRFRQFPVYIKAKELYRLILQQTDETRIRSLQDQARRAALSISLNIAEGSAKRSDKEFARYLQVSLGSVNELVACLDVMSDNNMIRPDIFAKLMTNCEDIARQLGGLYRSLNQS